MCETKPVYASTRYSAAPVYVVCFTLVYYHDVVVALHKVCFTLVYYHDVVVALHNRKYCILSMIKIQIGFQVRNFSITRKWSRRPVNTFLGLGNMSSGRMLSGNRRWWPKYQDVHLPRRPEHACSWEQKQHWDIATKPMRADWLHSRFRCSTRRRQDT